MWTLWVWCAAQASAGFLTPIPAVTGEAQIELVSGESLQGRVVSATLLNGSVRKLKLKDAEGAKHKLAAADVDRLLVSPSKLARAAAAIEGSSSLTEASRTDTHEIMGRDAVVYEQRLLPSGKPALLQLLNPGTDHLWKVYADPNAQQTGTVGVGGIDVAGGADKSYLVAREGSAQTMKVSKKDYDQQVSELYGGCPTFTVPDKPKFMDFAEHLAAFDGACAIKGPMPQGPISSLPLTGPPEVEVEELDAAEEVDEEGMPEEAETPDEAN